MTLLTFHDETVVTVPREVEPLRPRPRRLLALLVIMATAAAGALTGYQLQASAVLEYEAEATVLVQRTAAEDLLGSDGRSRDEIDRALATDVSILQRRGSQLEIEARAGSRVSYAVSHEEGTDLIVVSARATTAARAVEHADLVATYYAEQRSVDEKAELEAAVAALQGPIVRLVATLADLESQIVDIDGEEVVDRSLSAQIDAVETELSANRSALEQLRVELSISDGGARIVQPAIAPMEPVTPGPQRVAVLYGIVGLGVGIALVWLVNQARVSRQQRLGQR